MTSGYSKYAAFHAALRLGNLIRTKEFFDGRPDALVAKITPLGQTALEIPVVFGHVDIVKELASQNKSWKIKLMSRPQL